MLPEGFGVYQFVKKISQGTMGVVYQVYHPHLEQYYALKILHPLHQQSSELLERFYQEAQIISRLKHPYIVHANDFGKKGQNYYFVMDFIEGITLEEWLQQEHSLEESLQLFRKILEALFYAHQEKVIHRDLKPSNILVTVAGDPKITDFGLAKQSEVYREAPQLTMEGEVLGTPRFMSPEQASGWIEHIDERSDIYSAGVCLYRMLTRHCPFEDENLTTLFYKVMTQDPPLPSKWNLKIGKDLEAILLKSLEKQKTKRYQSARSFLQDLDRWIQGYPVQARQSTFFERLLKGIKRHRFSVSVGVVFCLLMVLLLGVFRWQRYQGLQSQLAGIQENLEKMKKTSLNQTSLEQIPLLLQALKEVYIALSLASDSVYFLTQKCDLESLLFEKACLQREYRLASYLVKQLEEHPFISEEEKERIRQELEKIQKQEFVQHQTQFQEWVQQLSTQEVEPALQEEALFDISQMPEEEIFQELKRLTQEGFEYFLGVRKRDSIQKEFYLTMLRCLGRLERPEIGTFLFQSLKTLATHVAQIPVGEQEGDQIQYMVELTQALVYCKTKEISPSDLKEIRYLLGQHSSYWRKSTLAYQQFLQQHRESTSSNNETHEQTPSELLELALLRSHQEDWSTAIDFFTRYIFLVPEDSHGYLNRGIAYVQQKKFDKAKKDYEKAKELQPKNSKIYNAFSDLYFELKQYDKALESVEQTILLDPELSLYYLNRAAIFITLKRYKEAENDYNFILHKEPKNPQAYFARASLKEKQKDFQGALEDYSKVIELDPQYPEIYTQRSALYTVLSSDDLAIADLDHAFKQNAKNPKNYYIRGNIKYSKGDLNGALLDYQEALALHFHSADVYYNRGVVYYEQGKSKEALKDFDRALEIDPEHILTYKKMGIICYYAKEYATAEACFLKALKGDPSSGDPYCWLGHIKKIQYQDKEAIDYYTQAIQCDPQNADAYSHRGLMYEIQNQP
jgi:serine/threonine protein kinase/tetratricopeptide (TPR) repeat protein